MTQDRYIAIDAVRGFAVLGILLMNIVGMGLPAYAYLDPSFYGGAEGANLWTWAANFVLVDGKMRALFTMLFGASFLLVIDRAEQAGESPAKVHYSRMVWLLVFGLIHGWLIWYGDILYQYALVGMLVFFARRWSPAVLIGAGAAITLAYAGYGWFIEAPGLAAERAAALGDSPTREAVMRWAAESFLAPPPEMGAQEIAGYRGGFLDALQARAFMTFIMQGPFFLTGGLFDVGGLMLIGMGLYRLGLFTGAWPVRGYLLLIALGYLVALPLHLPLVREQIVTQWDPVTLVRVEAGLAVLRLFVALAHAAVVILLVRAWPRSAPAVRLAAAGRMALTNYLTASLIATTLFYGYGFGLFARLERAELYWVVAGIWAVQIAWSKPWLDRFRYGPFEWVWRSLARRRLQPIRGAASGS